MLQKVLGVFFLILIIHSFTSSLLAQEKRKIEGRILQNSNQPLENVSVLLLKFPDSSLVKSTITNKYGLFEFEKITPGKYLLALSLMSYSKTSAGPFTLTDGKNLNTGDIIMLSLIEVLEEVIVQDKKPFLEVKPGKIILNIDNSLIYSGNNALEILKRSPGIQINQESITMKGISTPLITIDGKAVYVDYEEIMSFLQTIESSVIDQIELITNPKSKDDAGGGAGIINIRLKKGHALGINGSINNGFGYGDTYKGTSGINMNYRNGRFNLYGLYNYGNNKRPESISINRYTDFKNVLTNFDITNTDLKHRNTNNYKVGLDFNLSKRNVLGIMYSGFYNTLTSDEGNESIIRNNSKLDSIIKTSSLERRKILSNAFNINYKGQIAKSEVGVDLDYFTYDRQSDERITYSYLSPLNSSYKPNENLKNNSPSFYTIKTVKIDYTYNVSKTSQLGAGIKNSTVESTNNRIFEMLKNQNWLIDTSLSNNFNLKEIINAAYLSYNLQFSENYFEAGVRAEQTETRGTPKNDSGFNRDYLDFFPNIQLTRNLNAKNKILISYSRRIGRPSYESLNPFLFFLDRYTYREGNPNLKPEYTNTYEISHVFKNKYNTTLSYNFIKDPFFAIIEQNDSTRITRNLEKNFKNQTNYSLAFNSPFQVKQWWSGNLNLESYYQYFIFDDSSGYNTESSFFTFNTIQNFSLNKSISAEIGFAYESRKNIGIYTFKPTYLLDVGMGKTLWNKKASIRFSISDIFNSDRFNYFTAVENLNLRAIEKLESRIARVNFIYRFGTAISKSTSNRDTGNSDEKERLKN